MQPAHRFRYHWAIRHLYVFIALAGIVMILLAGPISSLYQLSPEEYAVASENDVRGLDYKGKNFLDWRYGWLGVFFSLLYAGLAFLAVAVALFATNQVGAFLKQSAAGENQS